MRMHIGCNATAFARALILLVALASGACPCRAQGQPAHFTLGADALEGVEIYDIAQDAADRYVIATNEGLLRYDFHKFQTLPCLGTQSLGVFNLVAAPDGNLYCSNLNRQIFKLSGNGCTLLYTLEPDEAAADMSLAIGPSGELVVGARHLIRLDSSGRVLERLVRKTTYWGLPFRLGDGSLLYHLPARDSACRIDAGGMSLQKLHFEPETTVKDGVMTFFRVGDRSHAVALKTKTLYAMDEGTLTLRQLPDAAELRHSPSLRVYSQGEEIWLAGTLPGALRLGKSWPQEEASLLYPHEFISEVYQDREGNVLLGTFRKGIMVVPHPDRRDAILIAEGKAVTALHADAERQSLYLGTQDGMLLRLRGGDIDTLTQGGSRSLTCLIGAAGFPYLVFNDGSIRALDLNTDAVRPLGDWALKDGAVQDSQTAFLATNKGLLRCESPAQGLPSVALVPGMEMRIYQVEIVGGRVVASTSAGLRVLEGASPEAIRLGDKEIYPTAMTAWKGRLLATTPDGAIVAWGGEQPSIVGKVPIGLLGHCRKLLANGDELVAMMSQALYTVGADLRLHRNLSQEWGLPTRRVMDFVLSGDGLWVSHAEGLQRISLSGRPGHAPLQPRFAEIKVNGAVVSGDAARDWPSDHRSFEFALAYPSLRHQASVRIHFRLLGYDDQWVVRPNDGQTVKYNALAPGDYRFQARAEFDGALGEPIEYPFSIAAPLYARPSFYILVAVLALAVVVLVFLQILRVQRRKAQRINELNLSKLTAIQSQMNPHFLFNALNSIQDLVLKGDVEHSYTYITTFSNLVRSTLDYSAKEFIDLEQELRLLNLYLSLEQLRFKHTLQYVIEADDIEDIQLPPFLIQPFVENALVHGLLHKAGERRLRITFALGEQLVCTIEDNGIGRAAAAAIERRQSAGHASFASSAVGRRFELLGERLQDTFGMAYEDLMEDGKPAGTRVVLRIPVQRAF